MSVVDDEALDRARDHLSRVIQEEADGLGPVQDVDSDDDQYICSAWVLVMNWTAMDSGDNFTVMTAPRTVLRTHRNGLLWEGLNVLDRD